MNQKISARRYGRLLAVLYLKDHLEELSNDPISESYIEQLPSYLPEYPSLPSGVQQQIVSFANSLVSTVHTDSDDLITTISTYSKNREWNRFFSLDKALLLIGALGLKQDTPSALIIKETLIVSDLLENHKAAPYLSGILKCMAGTNIRPSIPNFKKTSKIRLKSSE